MRTQTCQTVCEAPRLQSQTLCLIVSTVCKRTLDRKTMMDWPSFEVFPASLSSFGDMLEGWCKAAGNEIETKPKREDPVLYIVLMVAVQAYRQHRSFDRLSPLYEDRTGRTRVAVLICTRYLEGAAVTTD